MGSKYYAEKSKDLPPAHGWGGDECVHTLSVSAVYNTETMGDSKHIHHNSIDTGKNSKRTKNKRDVVY